MNPTGATRRISDPVQKGEGRGRGQEQKSIEVCFRLHGGTSHTIKRAIRTTNGKEETLDGRMVSRQGGAKEKAAKERRGKADS